MPSDPHLERDETVDAFVARASRRAGAVPLRTVFVQRGRQRAPVPGPLHHLVRAHDERALDLYLLTRAIVSSDETSGAWDVCLDAAIWARGLGLPTARDDGAAAVSKTWRRLEDRGLIERERQGRLNNVTVLYESGTGRPYTYPSGKGAGRYFKLTEEFWTADERWYRTLSLAAKAMLLVASSLKPGFVLPLAQARPWYGISHSTAADGLNELRDRGLLRIDKKSRKEPMSKAGYVVENHHTLLGPFAQNWRTKNLATVTWLNPDDAEAGAEGA